MRVDLAMLEFGVIPPVRSGRAPCNKLGGIGSLGPSGWDLGTGMVEPVQRRSAEKRSRESFGRVLGKFEPRRTGTV